MKVEERTFKVQIPTLECSRCKAVWEPLPNRGGEWWFRDGVVSEDKPLQAAGVTWPPGWLSFQPIHFTEDAGVRRGNLCPSCETEFQKWMKQGAPPSPFPYRGPEVR